MAELLVWAAGIVLGYSLLHWSVGSRGGSFGEDVYLSGGEFLSAASGPDIATGTRVLGLLEAATGIGVVFVVIGYLPSIYGAFSRREIAISQLSTRAGSPATAAALLRRVAALGTGDDLARWLADAEAWATELMETQLSFPLLAWYRSQHLDQNWLAALTVMVDAAAVVMAASNEHDEGQAQLTYAVGRHALSDIALQFGVRSVGTRERLDDTQLRELRSSLAACGVTRDAESIRRRLDHLRSGYEQNAVALAQLLELRIPAFA